MFLVHFELDKNTSGDNKLVFACLEIPWHNRFNYFWLVTVKRATIQTGFCARTTLLMVIPYRRTAYQQVYRPIAFLQRVSICTPIPPEALY